MLSQNEKINWQRFLQALTDEDKAFNFPVKYPAIDLDKSTKQSLYITSGIIAGGLILAAFIVANGKKR
jgi:hypothetical protein